MSGEVIKKMEDFKSSDWPLHSWGSLVKSEMNYPVLEMLGATIGCGNWKEMGKIIGQTYYTGFSLA